MNPYLEMCLSHKISAKDTPTEPLDGEPRDSVARQPGERIRKGIKALRRTVRDPRLSSARLAASEGGGLGRRRSRGPGGVLGGQHVGRALYMPAPQGRVARHQRAAGGAASGRSSLGAAHQAAAGWGPLARERRAHEAAAARGRGDKSPHQRWSRGTPGTRSGA